MPAPTRERLNLAAHNLLRRVARRRLRLDLVRADFYSPILDPASLPASHWEQADPMPGIELDLAGQLQLIDERLRPALDEFHPPLHPPPTPPAGAPPGPPMLHLDNPWYGPMDAHLLYAMLRHRPPDRVLELGSGFSTLFIERALGRGALERARRSGARATHQVVDPHPSPLLDSLGGDVIELRTQSAADTPQALFDALGPGDVLFVDTSHAVRPGGEVIRLVLEVLPSLNAGVLVHFHDIFRPFDYPRVFYERYNVHWQEQYLLQAFLAYNPNFRIVLANHALWRLYPERMKHEFDGLRDGMQPSGFWFVREP